jgi:hypothetical protein
MKKTEKKYADIHRFLRDFGTTGQCYAYLSDLKWSSYTCRKYGHSLLKGVSGITTSVKSASMMSPVYRILCPTTSSPFQQSIPDDTPAYYFEEGYIYP